MLGGFLKLVLTPLFILSFLLFAVGCVQGDGDNVLSASSVNNVPFEVLSTSPADGALSIASESTLSLSFSAPIDFSTLTVNSNTTQCLGSVQVSNNSFASCILFLPAVGRSSDTTAVLTPTDIFVSGQTYKLRLSADIKSAAGKTIESLYSHTTGFKIFGDSSYPTIVSVTPANGSVEIVPSSTINVTFSEPMVAGLISTNTGDTSCSGTLQLTSDNFATCIQMTSSPIPADGARSFTITPTSDLTPNTTYQFKIDSGLTDLSGKGLTASTKFFTVASTRIVKLTWAKSPSAAVNIVGGGYRIYSSITPNFNIDTVTSVNVPYTSGASAPVEKEITIYQKGTWYFKIKAYSANNLVGSDTSTEISVNVE